MIVKIYYDNCTKNDIIDDYNRSNKDKIGNCISGNGETLIYCHDKYTQTGRKLPMVKALLPVTCCTFNHVINAEIG